MGRGAFRWPTDEERTRTREKKNRDGRWGEIETKKEEKAQEGRKGDGDMQGFYTKRGIE